MCAFYCFRIPTSQLLTKKQLRPCVTLFKQSGGGDLMLAVTFIGGPYQRGLRRLCECPRYVVA